MDSAGGAEAPKAPPYIRHCKLCQLVRVSSGFQNCELLFDISRFSIDSIDEVC